MYLTNGTIQDLQNALNVINENYENNIVFKRLEQISKNRVLFTLTVRDSSKPGARRGLQFNKNGERKKLAAACWHAHGDFYDAVFNINSNAVITSLGKKITVNRGNWIDWNAGSLYNPVYMSELCDC